MQQKKKKKVPSYEGKIKHLQKGLKVDPERKVDTGLDINPNPTVWALENAQEKYTKHK